MSPRLYQWVINGTICQGCDIEKDATVLKSGELVGASESGLLASVGAMMVKVWNISS